MTNLSRDLDALRSRLGSLLFPSIREETAEGSTLVVKDAERSRAILRLRANSLRVSAELTPRIEAAALAVAQSLGCPRDLFEVYVFPRSETNGFCLTDHLPVTIGVSSEAIRMLDDRELRFLIGHELGHACFRETTDESAGNGSIEGAMRSRLVELTVDRVGLLAAQDVEASCRAIVKTISGLQEGELRFDFARFTQDIRELDRDDAPLADVLSTHPPLPIRFRALLAFSRSEMGAGLLGESADSGIRLDSINRLIERALDRTVDARARFVISRAISDALLWLIVYAIVRKVRISLSAVEASTGIMIDRTHVEQAIGFINGFSEAERESLAQDKVHTSVSQAFECAPRRMVRLMSQIDSVFPDLRLTVQIPGFRLEQQLRH
jgi:hypothetical protein